MKKVKSSKGITLIALIITVIVLLILAGTAISIAINGGDIFSKATTAREEWNTAVKSEETTMLELLEIADDATNPDKQALKLLVNSGNDGIVTLAIPVDTRCQIDWGDGAVTTGSNDNFIQSSYKVASKDGIKIAAHQEPAIPDGYSHEYDVNNREYEVSITGIDVYGCLINNGTPEKIIKVLQWGQQRLVFASFYECTNLTSIASPTTNSFRNSEDLYISFIGCTSLTSVPSDLFKYCTNINSFNSTFSGCTSLISIPSDLFKYNTNATLMEFTFSSCTSLTSIPSDLFEYNTNVRNFFFTFSDCSGLTSIPSNLFSNCQDVAIFQGTFSNCTSITGQAIPLWERMENGATYNYEPLYSEDILSRGPDGDGCYYNCINLTNYSSIPEYWKEELIIR